MQYMGFRSLCWPFFGTRHWSLRNLSVNDFDFTGFKLLSGKKKKFLLFSKWGKNYFLEITSISIEKFYYCRIILISCDFFPPTNICSVPNMRKAVLAPSISPALRGLTLSWQEHGFPLTRRSLCPATAQTLSFPHWAASCCVSCNEGRRQRDTFPDWKKKKKR